MIRAPADTPRAALGDLGLDGARGQRGAVVDPRTITVSAVSSNSRPWSGSTWKPSVLRTGRPPGCTPGRRRRASGRRPGSAEDLGRGAEVQADHVVQGEYGDPVRASAHGPIIAHDGFPATRQGERPGPDSFT
ncbi:hypothetical protein NKG94_28600 [Micromonospora sp. M12]